MSENPYEPPSAAAAVVEITSGDRRDSVKVAQYQKGVLVCLLVNILAYVGALLGPLGLRTLCAWVLIVGSLAACVFAFMLAIKVSNVIVGILMGLLTLIPFVNLFVLLIINQRATRVLMRNGIKVGFMGANLSAIKVEPNG